MELLNYLRILWQRRWVVLLPFLVALGITLIGARFLPSEYTAYALVRINTVLTGDASWTDYNLSYSERLTQTYITLATSGPMRQRLGAELGVTNLPRIGAAPLPNTELVEITATSTDAQLAARTATGLAYIFSTRAWESDLSETASDDQRVDALLEKAQADLIALQAERQQLLNNSAVESSRISALEGEIDDAQNRIDLLSEQLTRQIYLDARRRIAVSVVEEAETPVSPSGPNTRIFYVLGAVIGVVGGVGLAFLFASVDDRIFSPTEVEAITSLPIIGKIPRIRTSKSGAQMSNQSLEAESFQRLYLDLQSRGAGDPDAANNGTSRTFFVLLVTSASPEEGKSTITSNLARTFAKAGRDVLVVDADLRKPSLHNVFGISNTSGLGEVLRGELQPKQVIRTAKQRTPNMGVLSVITSGRMNEQPSQLLISWRMSHLLKEVGTEYPIILIDSPASLVITDAQALVPLVDGVLLVTRRGHTLRQSLEIVSKQFREAHAPLVGVVLNEAELDEEHRQYHYYQKRTLD